MVNSTELHDIHRCVVISNNTFNDNQSEGVVVIPLTTGQLSNSKPKPTWVRVRSDGQLALVLCEQVRFVDKRHCADEKEPHSRLSKYDWDQVRLVLTKLLFPPIEDLEDLGNPIPSN